MCISDRYKKAEAPQSGGKFFGKNSGPAMDPDLQKLLSDTKIEEMLLKSEWLWNQYEDKEMISRHQRKLHTVLYA